MEWNFVSIYQFLRVCQVFHSRFHMTCLWSVWRHLQCFCKTFEKSLIINSIDFFPLRSFSKILFPVSIFINSTSSRICLTQYNVNFELNLKVPKYHNNDSVSRCKFFFEVISKFSLTPLLLLFIWSFYIERIWKKSVCQSIVWREISAVFTLSGAPKLVTTIPAIRSPVTHMMFINTRRGVAAHKPSTTWNHDILQTFNRHKFFIATFKHFCKSLLSVIITIIIIMLKPSSFLKIRINIIFFSEERTQHTNY